MTSLSDPPCLIEHELYVENAVWIVYTLSTQKCSSNERLRPRGGGGTLIFSYIRRLFWAQNFELQYSFWFSENEYFLVVWRKNFGGAWNFWYFLGVNGRCRARAEVWRTNQRSPLWVLRVVLCRLKAPFECETKCGSIWADLSKIAFKKTVETE